MRPAIGHRTERMRVTLRCACSMARGVTERPIHILDEAVGSRRLVPGGARQRRLLLIVAAFVMLAIAVVLGVSLRHRDAVPKHAGRAATTTMLPPSPVVEEQRLIDVPPETARVINDKTPFVVAGPLAAARPFHFAGDPDARARALGCLAAAALYEAGDDPVGQRAVVQVILNRARNPAFPGSVCGVVFQGSERGTGCQFTFTCDGALHRRQSPAAWGRATATANAALAGVVDPSVGLATHYHADYVVPYWQSSLDKIARVGLHIFYRWKGFWGTPAAFSNDGGRAPEPAYRILAELFPAHAVAGALATYDGPPIAALPGVPELTAAAGVVPVPPPVMVVEGVREKSLRGAVVRGDGQAHNQFFLQLDSSVFPGSYATAAIALCKGKPVCTVFGWRDVAQVASGLPLNDAQRRALTFSFARNDAGEHALWNCQQIERTNTAQCLPPLSPLVGTSVPPAHGATQGTDGRKPPPTAKAAANRP